MLLFFYLVESHWLFILLWCDWTFVQNFTCIMLPGSSSCLQNFYMYGFLGPRPLPLYDFTTGSHLPPKLPLVSLSENRYWSNSYKVEEAVARGSTMWSWGAREHYAIATEVALNSNCPQQWDFKKNNKFYMWAWLCAVHVCVNWCWLQGALLMGTATLSVIFDLCYPHWAFQVEWQGEVVSRLLICGATPTQEVGCAVVVGCGGLSLCAFWYCPAVLLVVGHIHFVNRHPWRTGQCCCGCVLVPPFWSASGPLSIYGTLLALAATSLQRVSFK